MRVRRPDAKLRATILCVLLTFLSCSQVKTLHRADLLSSDEQLEYLVLAAISPDAALEYASASTGHNRTDFLDWFWAQPERQTQLPHSTYRERARVARELFGRTDLLGDDRVRTYINYGSSRREQYEPRPVETETSLTFANPAEIWTYDRLGRQFDFVRYGTSFRLVGENRFGPGFVAPVFEPIDSIPAVQFAETGGPSFNIDLSLGRLRQVADSVEVEVQFGVDGATLASLPEPDNRLMRARLTVLPRGHGRRFTRTLWMSYPSDSGCIVARQTLWLPADAYRVMLTLARLGQLGSGTRVSELNLIDYIRHQQPCSDALFYSLVDSSYQSSQFARSEWRRVIPLPHRRVISGSVFYVLYEIYSLRPDNDGQHRIEVTSELIAKETRQLAVIPVPSRFISGSGSTATVVERIHTMDLKPGPYLLVSRILDLNSGRTTSLTAEFEIAPRPRY
ncbi:MAG: hypothetical protein ABIK86_03820 [candidate division WOR-3 bacterium]